MNTNSSTESQMQPNRYNPRMIRRKFLLTFLIVVICIYFYNPLKPKAFRTKKRIFILGFDGADPGLLDQWMKESPDDFPNLRKLAGMGTQKQLQTSFPPESPVAWSCFAIGAGPGKHGVYDFLRRPTGSYLPSLESFVKKGNPEFLLHMIPIKMPKAIQRRGGVAFWDVLSRHGVRTSLIEIPVTFPPPKLSYGQALSGLGVPDIRGMQATFHHFVYDKNADKPLSQETTFGGKIEELKKDKEEYVGTIWGPFDPIADQIKREKEKEYLDKCLETYEWQAQIFSIQGEKFATPEDKANLADLINSKICATIAYQEYLDSEEFEQRIQNLKNFLVGSQKTYTKGKDLTASQIRERMQASLIRSKELNQESLSASRPIKLPVSFRPIGTDTIEIKVGKEIKQVKLNTWSDCFTLAFPVMAMMKAYAICKFYPQEISDTTLKVFMTSPDIDPRNPVIPVSYPKSYSKDLVDWLGEPYKTRGWSEETHGLKDGRLSEEAFIEDLFDIMDQREKKLFETLKRTENNVVISVFSETDRVAHMFYHHIDDGHPMHKPEFAQKYGDVMKRVYKRMDEIVGRMMTAIGNDPDTTLMVMSDHGFSSFRYQVHLNKWLLDNGYIALNTSGLQASSMKLTDFLQGDKTNFFSYVNWKETRAYSLGLGQIYINLKGREPLGFVEKQDYEALCTEIATKLSTLVDDRPERHGESVIAHVKKRSEIWVGPYGDDAHDCPDLQVCFHRPYRVSWQTCMGGISPGHVLEDNLEKWSGDHCSLNPEEVPGMFFCNRPIREQEVSIYDFAPTVLSHFGLKIPQGVEGKDLGIL